MPYCPKCDMEFVEGITVCTDCGGPLMESKEAAEAIKKAEKEAEEAKLRLQYEQQYEEYLENSAAEDQAPPAGAGPLTVQKKAPSRVYVKAEQRYEDTKASASAFLLIGGALAVASVLFWAGIIKLPMAGFTKYMFQSIMTALAIGGLAIAYISRKSAAAMKTKIAEEERETEEILHWFLTTYSANGLDEQIHSEDPSLSGEELSLKRFELIQDYLITGRDLPDQSYADSLCDTLYAKLYDPQDQN